MSDWEEYDTVFCEVLGFKYSAIWIPVRDLRVEEVNTVFEVE
jgi:hypothetical protein